MDSGITDLQRILRSLELTVKSEEYVYATVEKHRLDELAPEAAIVENEGWTVVITRTRADQAELEYSFVAAWISLTVHSSLEAVGLTATFSTALGEAGISCNVLAGNYHDHILVPYERRTEAVAVLERLKTATLGSE